MQTLTWKSSENKVSQDREKYFYWTTVTNLDENSYETDPESYTGKTFDFILYVFLLS